MARLLYTVDNIISDIRSKLDEENTDSINTDRDLLPALNRAQDYAFDVLARRYPEPLLRPSPLTLVGNVSEYDLPEDVFEDRLLKVEIAIPCGNGQFTYEELTRISYRDINKYKSTATVAIPAYYACYGRKILIVDSPSGTYNAQLWTLREVEKLMRPQGRITVVNNAGNYVAVDSLGDSLTTESDQLGSYCNVVDGQTGEIKGSLQVQTLSADRTRFRTSPLRTTVLGRTISSDLSDVVVELDDYLAPIDGTCVPYYSKPLINFMIEYTVADLEGRLAEDSQLEQQIVEKLEKQLGATWAGRETQWRVKKRSRVWSRRSPGRRWWGTSRT